MGSLWDTIAEEAGRESQLWAGSLLAREERQLLPVFSPLAEARYALGLESIYEGYLLHYGRPRLFGPSDRDTAVLLGDYLYAHGLVRVAGLGEVEVVADLAELLSLCAQVRADGGGMPRDAAAWAATTALLGAADGRLEEGRSALREAGDPVPLLELAEDKAGAPAVARALALHGGRVD
jgi:hypothetical protein